MGDAYNECPRCSEDLGWGSTSCAKCGWRKRRAGKAEAPHRDSVQCAHDACLDDALIRLRLATGWANLCVGHYVSHHAGVATLWCRLAGLDTVKKMRAEIRDKLATIKAGGHGPSRAWMDQLGQRGVDILRRTGDERTLAELRERGVIDVHNQIIERPAVPREEAA